MKNILIAGLLTIASIGSAVAAEEIKYTFLYGYASHHWLTMDHTNSTHHLTALRVDNVIFGRFNNSYDHETTFIGYYGEKYLDLDFDLLYSVGLMRGYTKCYGDSPNSSTKVCPMVAVGFVYKGFGDTLQPTLLQLGDASVIGFNVNF